MEQFARGMSELPKALKQLGFDSLRPGQVAPVNTIMAGRDTMAILQTGGGKTAIFEVPTIALKLHTLVFSPLIALMRDQVQSLCNHGLRAAAINTNNKPAQNTAILQEWVDGKIDVLFLAPERAENEQVTYALTAVRPDLVVLDEAHLMSSWSTAFRPSYKRCGDIVESLNPKMVLALTATATDDIIEDVKRILKIPNCILHWNYEARTNLKLSSEYVSSDDDLNDKLLNLVRSIDGSIIIYADTIDHVNRIASYLSNCGEEVSAYTGKMKAQDRSISQDSFMSGNVRIMVATNSFGMGVDKPDIRGVIHAYPPGSLEAVSQETGRASRDGGPAVCHMFYNNFNTQKFMVSNTFPNKSAAWRVWKVLKAKADADNIVRATVTEITKEAKLDVTDGGSGVIGVLTALGCTERLDTEHIVGRIIRRAGAMPASVKQIKMLETIVSVSLHTGKTINGEDKYDVYIDTLSDILDLTESTVKKHLKSMADDGLIAYTPPLPGKAIKLLREPTNEDYDKVDKRRNAELAKVAMVADYCKCPDKDKQTLLDNYFKLKGAVKNG